MNTIPTGKKSFFSLNTSLDIGAENQLVASEPTILATMSAPDIIMYLKPLTTSRSIPTLSESMRGLTAARSAEIIQILLDETASQLLPDDVKALILNVAVDYADVKDQDLILDLYLKNKYAQQSLPLFAVAAQLPRFNLIVPMLIRWQKNAHQADGLPADMILVAYEYAVKKDDPLIIKNLLQAGATVTPDQATRVLWQAVRENKNSNFITLLAKQAADVNSVENNMTPLVQATLNLNSQLVASLLQAGADINKSPADQTGTPLQNILVIGSRAAQEKRKDIAQKAVQLELFLREQGARE